MVMAHRDAPMGDSAARVGLGGRGESSRRLGIFERMEPAEPALERRVGLRVAARLERDLAQLRAVIVVGILCGGGGRQSEGRDGEKKLHGSTSTRPLAQSALRLRA